MLRRRPFRVIQLTDGMLQLAGRLPHRNLGTLEAIHIATALSVRATALMSFDARQRAAAEVEGLAVVSPGREG